MKAKIIRFTMKRFAWFVVFFTTLPCFAGFDIWLYPLTFDNKKQNWSIGNGSAITQNQKYNNQPSFTLSGKALLFASNKSGNFNDIYSYSIEKQSVTAITNTPMESEFSPIDTKTGINYVIEQGVPHQSIWYNEDNEPRKRTINSLIPAGYFATHESLGTLIWARYAGDLFFEPKGETANENHFVVANAGRSLHRIPGENNFSYLHKQTDGEAIIKRFNPITLSHTSLVKITGASQDYAWSNNQWLFNFKNNNLRTWQYHREKNNFTTDWKTLANIPSPKGYNFASRLAISPDNNFIAIVWQTSQ